MVVGAILDAKGFILNSAIFDVVLSALCLFVVVKVVNPAVKSYRHAKKLDKIAGTRKAHWFYGNIRQFGTKPHDRIQGLMKLSSMFSTMFNSWRGPLMSRLILLHPNAMKAVASSGAPKDELGYKFLRPWLGDGLLTSKGKKWKRNRILLTPAFHFSVLKPYMQISNQTVRVLIEKWKTKNNGPLEISNDISLMTLDTMVQCAMSTKTDCQSTEGEHPYIKAVRDISHAFTARFQNPLLLIEWIFRLSKPGKIFYHCVEVLHSHAEKIISDRKKKLETHDNEKKKRAYDFIDILLQTKDEEGRGLTDQEIRDEVDTFLFEGHDTTSSGISWALYNLAKYPEFQEKCREEVQSICRDQDDIEWEDLSRLPYLTMFLKESLRLFPPVVVIGRKLENPLKFKTDAGSLKEIPTKTTIAVQILSLHRHPDFWSDPEEFIPERFTKENSAKRNPHAYVPFSSGARNCIGQNFAMNEMKVCLSQILRNFRLYLDEETPTPTMEIRLILQPEKGLYIKLEPINE